MICSVACPGAFHHIPQLVQWTTFATEQSEMSTNMYFLSPLSPGLGRRRSCWVSRWKWKVLTFLCKVPWDNVCCDLAPYKYIWIELHFHWQFNLVWESPNHLNVEVLQRTASHILLLSFLISQIFVNDFTTYKQQKVVAESDPQSKKINLAVWRAGSQLYSYSVIRPHKCSTHTKCSHLYCFVLSLTHPHKHFHMLRWEPLVHE